MLAFAMPGATFPRVGVRALHITLLFRELPHLYYLAVALDWADRFLASATFSSPIPTRRYPDSSRHVTAPPVPHAAEGSPVYRDTTYY